MKKLIILDRDGVINYDSDEYIKSLDEFRFLPGSIDAIAKLKHAGYMVVVATNQSGIARGYFDVATLEQMHAKLAQALAEKGAKIDAIYYCPHGPDDHCDCRKPKPGLLRRALADFKIAPEDAIVVGDSLRDLEAGEVLGIASILVKTGKGAKSQAKREQDGSFAKVPVYQDLAAVVEQVFCRDQV